MILPHRHPFTTLWFTLVLNTWTIPASSQSVIYVDHNATGVNNGTSWNNAFTFLQDAMQAAQIGDEVWVSYGTYRPDRGAGVALGDREASFSIPGGVSLFGGFSGNESTRFERDWIENKTILSGDLLENDDELLTLDNPLRFDNAYHVVRMLDLSDKVVLDGFTIIGGMANAYADFDGAALEIKIAQPDPVVPGLIQISNCVFKNNVAERGAVAINVGPSPSEPAVLIVDSEIRNNWGLSIAGIDAVSGKTLIRNVLITENEAAVTGAIDIGNETVYVVGSVISHNRAQDQISAGTGASLYMWDNTIVANTSFLAPVHIHDATYVSMNNVFTGNSDSSWGSAIFVNGGDTNIINNVFAFNEGGGVGGIVGSGSAIFSEYARTNVSNSIFWENTSPLNSEIVNRSSAKGTAQINYSLLQHPLAAGVVDGGGLISGDPLFQDADGNDNIPGTIDDDFRLTGLSPALDAGINDSLVADFLDLDEDFDTSEPWPTDFLSNMRVFDGGSGTATVDMGAIEFGAPAVGVAVEPAPDKPKIEAILLTNYPNPFAATTTLSYSLARPASVLIELYDVLGKRVRVIQRGFEIAGEQELRIEARELSAGIYFLRLTAGTRSQTRKTVIVN